MRKSYDFPAKTALARAFVASFLFWSAVSSSLGAIFPTEELLDVAIEGPGFFILKDPQGHVFYTRSGSFTFDSDGYLANPMGIPLQGLGGDLATPGPLRIGNTPATNVYLIGIAIQSDGTLQGSFSDSSNRPLGRILLQNLSNPESGLKFPEGLILQSPSIGATEPPSAPGSNGMGTLVAGYLEVPQPRLKIEGPVGKLSGFSNPLYISDYVDTDLAIRGRGFFILRDPSSGELYATRAGAFYWNPDGYLINYAGWRVQGLLSGADASGDIRINPAQDFYEADINWWGSIKLYISGSINTTVAQILLKDFDHPELLAKASFGSYKLTNPSGPWTDYSKPGDNGFGHIFAHIIDVSQVDDDIIAKRQRMNFFMQGLFEQTGEEPNCYISGRGMFIVRDPKSNRMYATRYGAFHLDSSNKMANVQGFFLQGIDGVSGPGDLTIDGEDATMAGFRIESDGRIRVTLTNANSLIRGQILLQDFADPHSLVRESNYLYSNIKNALPKFPNGGTVPGENLAGTVKSGAIEIIGLEPGIQIPPTNAVRLSISNHGNTGTWIETSSDFKNWRRLPENTFASDTGELSILDTDNDPSIPTFYRIVAQPPTLPIPIPLPPFGLIPTLPPLRGLAAKLQQR